MKRFLPQSLPAWVLVIVIAGLMISQVATLVIVARDRAAADDIVDLYRLNDRAFSLVQLMFQAPPEERKKLAAGLSNPNYALTVSDIPAVASEVPEDDVLAELDDIIVGRLTKFGIVEARVRHDPAGIAIADSDKPTDTDIGDVERDLLALASDFSSSDRLTASIRFADGQWLNFTAPVTPAAPVLSQDSLPVYALMAAFVLVMSIWASRRLTAPYRALERAVGRLATDIKSPPVPEAGSREYRSAARALNRMQAQIRDYVDDREHLAAALAHDLRTPLTRMRLRLEMIGRRSKVRDALMHDLGEINAIARSVVDFATLEVTEEQAERIDLWSMVATIADGYENVELDSNGAGRTALVCEARPVALRRCITNLLENALKYGKRAHVALVADGDEITLRIIDEGKGIPPKLLEEVFKPFARVEPSRNRQTGGLGLGLTIARNIARASGGDIFLYNQPGAGLCTELRLPRAG